MVEDRFKYGTDPRAVELRALIPIQRCLECGLEFSGEEAEHARQEAICRHLQLLTPQEITAVRARYGLSRIAFAEVTRIGTATLARWENGEVMQNAAMDAYMRLIAREAIFQELNSGALYQTVNTLNQEAQVVDDPFACLRGLDPAARRRLENGRGRFSLVG